MLALASRQTSDYLAPMNTEPTSTARGKILVIDDNQIIQRAIQLTLKDQGYQLLMCSVVYDAIGIIRKEQPNLILLDLSFPHDITNIGGPIQDGFFFIEWIRRMPEILAIPIIIISSTDPAKYRERVAEAGIKVCLQKPVKKEELLAGIERLLSGGTAASQPAQT